MDENNIIYSVMEGGYIHCHTNGQVYKNYDEFKKEMLCYYEKEELINIISNLQSKIDKAIDYLYEHSQYNDRDGIHYIKEDEYCVDYLLDILKEDK